MRKVLSTKKLDPSLSKFAADHQILLFEAEFIRITLLDNEKIRRQVNIGNKVIVVFTSKNAVNGLSAILENPKICEHWKIYCIAGATADLVKTRFDKTATGTAVNAGQLAHVITNNEVPQQVFFVCGNKRRDELPRALSAAGFSVEEIQVYESILIPVKTDDRFDAVMFFSPSAVQSFFSVNSIDPDTVCFSLGSTTTAELKKYTSYKIVTAGSPSEAEVVKLVARAW